MPKSNPKIIVTFTSYPARIGTVATALQPLLHQTVPPDAIYLWLARSEWEDGSRIPEELRELESETCFEVRWSDESLRPHNKYLWTMRENPDDIVITVDDDIVYPTGMIQTLLDQHYLHPEAIIANRTHIVTLGKDGELAGYSDWIMEQVRYEREERFDLMATGVGGVLYPPRCFPSDTLDIDAINRISAAADDTWLQAWDFMCGRPVVSTGAHWLTYIPGTQEVGLFHTAVDAGGNDVCLRQIYEAYPAYHDGLLEAVRKRTDEEREASDGGEQGGGLFGRLIKH